jgi:UDP-2,4-diacetamido-2,4,6-trideoxy-beta-L-altropyranose hydrolase
MNARFSLSAVSTLQRSGPWAFRVASAPEVGGGHMRRCLALAGALRTDARIVFILDRADAGIWGQAVTAAGMKWMLAGDEPDGPWTGCVIDGYAFGPQDYAGWRRRAGRLVVIDDIGRAPADADLVVNSTQPDAACGNAVLAGPAYAMLGKAFAAPPRAAPSERIEEVFISFGLRDSVGATGLALDALQRLAADGFQPRITVALGSSAPGLQRVKAQVAQLGEKARLLVDADNVRSLLDRTDLAIGAGGVGLYERLACGVPSLTVTIAENQRASAHNAADAGATIDLGDAADLTPAALAEATRDLAVDRGRRERLAQRGRQLVDGRGAERVARKILELTQCT